MTQLASAARRWRNPERWDGGPFRPHRETFGWNVPVPSAGSTALRAALWARIVATGATLVRTDADWSRLQPTNPTSAGPGLNDALDASYLADLDAFIDDAALHGIQVWFNLAYTPAWARTVTSLPGPITWGIVEHVPPSREPENGYPDYANAAWLLVNRYALRQSGTVVAVGIWNEPNIAEFWLQPPGTGTQPSVNYTPDAGRYAQLLRGAYDAIKSGVVAHRATRTAYPETYVTAGATAPATGTGNGTDYGPLEFLTEWISYSDSLARTAFDGLDHHPYAWQWSPSLNETWNAFQQMHDLWGALVAADRDDTLIWMSEVGSVTRPDASRTDPASPFAVGGYDTGPVPSGGWVTSSAAIDYTLGAQRVADYAAALRDAAWYDPAAGKSILGPSCWYNLNDTIGGIGTAWPAGSWSGHYGAYEYGTNGYDGPAKGNIPAQWATLFAPDVTPPIGNVTAPLDGDTLVGNVGVVVIATDNRDAVIETVTILVDGSPVARAVPYLGGYAASFDSATIPNGTHLLSARLVDAAGNVGVTPSRGVTFLNVTAPPIVQVPQPPPPVAVVTEYPPYTTDDLIDLVPGVGRVAMSTIYEVTTRTGSYLGTLYPVAGKPSLTMSTDRAITRTLSQVQFAAADLADINPVTDVLRPYTVYETGDRKALGVFLFADRSNVPRSSFVDTTGTFYDRGLILDQPIERAVTIRPGENIMDTLLILILECGITDIRIDGRALYPTTPIGWNAGTSRYEILKTIAAMLGCYNPYFDADGVLVIRAVPDLTVVLPDRTYNTGGRIDDGSVTISDDTFRAPNRYIVTGGSTQDEVSAYFDVPADAPHSIKNRGYVVAETINLSGISTYAAALAAAVAAYARDVRSWTVAEFVSTPDPRHGTYDVLELLGEPYVETGWTLDLKPGGDMRHQCSRIWTGL